MLTTLSSGADVASSGAGFTIPDGMYPAEKVSPPSEGRVSPTVSDRVNILGVGAAPQDLNDAVATLERWRAERRPDYVCVLSVHGLVAAQAIRRSGMPSTIAAWLSKPACRSCGGHVSRVSLRLVVSVAPICSMPRAPSFTGTPTKRP